MMKIIVKAISTTSVANLTNQFVTSLCLKYKTRAATKRRIQTIEIVNEIDPATNCQNPSPKIADKSTPINKTNDETKIAFVGTWFLDNLPNL